MRDGGDPLGRRFVTTSAARTTDAVAGCRPGGGPTTRTHWRGAASVVAPGTTIGCGHVPRPGRPIGEPVAQVHGALRTGYRRFEECDVRGHRATVEDLLPDAEHDRVHPEVETVEELLAQEGLHQVQAPDDLHVLVPVPDLAHRAE